MAKKVLTIKLDEITHDQFVAICDDSDKTRSELGANIIHNFVVSGLQGNSEQLQEISKNVKYLLTIFAKLNHDIEYMLKMLLFVVSGFPSLAGMIFKTKDSMQSWLSRIPVKGPITPN